jgi:RNA polymerase sigma-70 factor, ECF subfamily
VGTCAVAATKDSVPGMGLSAEIDLVCRAKEGDEQAFAALFQQNKKRVYSLCLLMTGDASQAEDLTQDSFIQVFRRLDTFRGEAAFSTWLYRVAVNTVLMTLRKHQPRQVSLDEPVRVESSLVPREFGRGDPRLLGAIDRIALGRAIGQLPAGCRTVFVLHAVEGYGHHEIAGFLHCSVGNSKSQLHKARLRLRELLLSNKKIRRRGTEPRSGSECDSQTSGSRTARLPAVVLQKSVLPPMAAAACSSGEELRGAEAMGTW